MGDIADDLIQDGCDAIAQHMVEGCDGPCQICDDYTKSLQPFGNTHREKRKTAMKRARGAKGSRKLKRKMRGKG